MQRSPPSSLRWQTRPPAAIPPASARKSDGNRTGLQRGWRRRRHSSGARQAASPASVGVGRTLPDENAVDVDVIESREAKVVRTGVVAFVEDDGEIANLEVGDVADARRRRRTRWVRARRKCKQRHVATPTHADVAHARHLRRGGRRVAPDEERPFRAGSPVARSDVPPRRARAAVRPAGAGGELGARLADVPAELCKRLAFDVLYPRKRGGEVHRGAGFRKKQTLDFLVLRVPGGARVVRKGRSFSTGTRERFVRRSEERRVGKVCRAGWLWGCYRVGHVVSW